MAENLYRVHVLQAGGSDGLVRLRVLLVHHEPWWDQDDLLPDSPGFFMQVLREAADGEFGRPGGPLAEEVGLEQSLDASFVDANAHRFVQRVERVAIRNHPVDDALAAFYRNNYDTLDRLYYKSTFNSGYRPDEHRPLEECLVQADYDVWTTDPRWTRTLRTGQCWGTDAWAPRTSEGAASARLGHLLWGRDRDGAVAAYRRAIQHGDAHTKVEARLELDDLLAGRDQDYDLGQRRRAALELGIQLRADGNEEEARAAYALAVCMGGAPVIAEARRRAGMESPAEHGYRLAQAGEFSRAAAELRAAYDDGSADVASFGLALYERDFARAEKIIRSLGGDLVIHWSAEVAIDLAFLHARAGDTDTARFLVDIAEGAGFAPGELFAYALKSGSAHPAELAMEIGTALVDDIVNPAWGDDIELIVEATRERLPELAAYACRAQAECETEYGQNENAAHWYERLAEIDTTTPTD